MIRFDSIRFDSFARSACREIQVVAELAVAVGCCGTYRNFSLKESVAAYPVRRNPTVCEILCCMLLPRWLWGSERHRKFVERLLLSIADSENFTPEITILSLVRPACHGDSSPLLERHLFASRTTVVVRAMFAFARKARDSSTTLLLLACVCCTRTWYRYMQLFIFQSFPSAAAQLNR